MNINLTDSSWNKVLLPLFHSKEFSELTTHLDSQKNLKKIIFPKEDSIFSAFNLTPFSKVKVVILGQDPYHGDGQAHGLCFSVQGDNLLPPSLKNIFKEISDDLQIDMPKNNGNLTPWAQQGVFLLNTILTVEKDQAASHRQIGWEHFTDQVISILSHQKNNLVFLLWGNEAKKKSVFIDKSKHLVLESGHPSPLSVRYFRGNKHFSKCNEYLQLKEISPIDWHLTEVPSKSVNGLKVFQHPSKQKEK